jgi:hypothetical protein
MRVKPDSFCSLNLFILFPFLSAFFFGFGPLGVPAFHKATWVNPINGISQPAIDVWAHPLFNLIAARVAKRHLPFSKKKATRF